MRLTIFVNITIFVLSPNVWSMQKLISFDDEISHGKKLVEKLNSIIAAGDPLNRIPIAVATKVKNIIVVNNYNINKTDDYALSPLDIALQSESLDLIFMLISYGAIYDVRLINLAKQCYEKKYLMPVKTLWVQNYKKLFIIALESGDLNIIIFLHRLYPNIYPTLMHSPLKDKFFNLILPLLNRATGNFIN